MTATQELLQLLQEKAYRRGRFKLANGTESDRYVDCRKVTMDPFGSRRIVWFLYERMKELKANTIGGPACGAIPIASAVVATIADVDGFWVRDSAKGHGTGSWIEGCDVAGRRVLLVDDVATSGKSLSWAASAVSNANATIVGVTVIVDRQEGAAELLKREFGLDLHSLFTVADLDKKICPQCGCEVRP